MHPSLPAAAPALVLQQLQKTAPQMVVVVVMVVAMVPPLLLLPLLLLLHQQWLRILHLPLPPPLLRSFYTHILPFSRPFIAAQRYCINISNCGRGGGGWGWGGQWDWKRGSFFFNKAKQYERRGGPLRPF